MRCANCRHDWFAEAADENHEIVPEFVDKSAAQVPADEPSPTPPEEDAPPDVAPEAESDQPPAPKEEPEEEIAPESAAEEEAGQETPEEEPGDTPEEPGEPDTPEEEPSEPEEEPEAAETPVEEDEAPVAEDEAESESEDSGTDEEESAESGGQDDESEPSDEIAQEDEEEDVFTRRSRRLKSKALRSNVPAVKKDSSAAIVGGWIALIIFILTTLWIIAFKQEFLIEAWPPSEKLYASLGMEIEVKQEEVVAPLPKPSEVVEFTHGSETEIIEGRIKLSISGNLINNGTFAVEIPKLKGILRNAAKEEIHSWTFSVEPTTLSPGEERSFSTIVDDIPPETAEFELFLEWPDEAS